MNLLDKFDTLARLHNLLPNQASEHLRIFRQLENQSAAWSTYSLEEFNTNVDLRLEALCRECRDENLSLIDARRREAMEDSWLNKLISNPRSITRDEVLRWTASASIDFNIECDKRNEKVYVNLTRFNSLSRFTVGIIEYSWLADFKRLHRGLFLKNDERLYVRTTREVNHFGKLKRREIPVISIAASAKYGVPNYDEVLTTAETVNTNHLDLTFDNIRIPSLERTQQTARKNEALLKKSVCGLDTSRVWDKSWDVVEKSGVAWGNGPVRPQGESPDSDHLEDAD